jgi:hypothetical protein
MGHLIVWLWALFILVMFGVSTTYFLAYQRALRQVSVVECNQRKKGALKRKYTVSNHKAPLKNPFGTSKYASKILCHMLVILQNCMLNRAQPSGEKDADNNHTEATVT